MQYRPLGSADFDVSLFSLGSWRTFERMSRDEGLAVMGRAREVGITFLDDARYNDETGTAPIASGYSEVVFGELFRATGWVRDEVVVANKLWWEFWPDQDAAGELDASLGRMGLDHIDVIYAVTLPEALSVAGAVGEVAGLLSSGKARCWAVTNWPADAVAEAVAECRRQGVPQPVCAQLPYSVVNNTWVDDPVMDAALADGGISLVASYVLAGGTLTGKYGRGEAGRVAPDTDDSQLRAGIEAAADVEALASAWGTDAATVALCFALGHPRLASILFGATRPAQIDANVAAADVFASLDDAQLAALRALAR